MNEAIKGWCIQYAHQGAAPILTECSVNATGTEGLYTEQAEPHVLRVHSRGVTFFQDRIPAMRGLIERLEDAKEGHQLAIAYLVDQVGMLRAAIKAEEAKPVMPGEVEGNSSGPEPSSGAKPRC